MASFAGMPASRLPGLLRRILVSALLFPGFASIASAAPVPSVAVLDFRGRGVSASFADSVSDALSAALQATGRFRALDRDSVSSWRDHGRGGSFLARCGDWECAIRAGRVMEVDRVVIGAVDAEGSSLRVSVRMMDVRRDLPLEQRESRWRRGSGGGIGGAIDSLAAGFAMLEPLPASAAEEALPSGEPPAPDRQKVGQLEKDVRFYRRTAGATAIAGGIALVVGGWLFALNSAGCVYSGEGVCKEPDRTAEHAWLAGGVVLEGFAVVSGIAAAGRGRELRDLRRDTKVALSWAPLWNPRSQAVGLASRLEF